jgi:hypothetical protein
MGGLAKKTRKELCDIACGYGRYSMGVRRAAIDELAIRGAKEELQALSNLSPSIYKELADRAKHRLKELEYK